MNRRIRKSPPASAAARNGTEWSAGRRMAVSAVIGFHVFAVFIAPLASPPPSSEISRAVAGVLRPYLQAVAIDNGYRFFAPNPGPSHLIRYEMDLRDGTSVTGRFPDVHQHWPRLLYHRHFMVAEMLCNLAIPVAELPPGGFASDAERQQFEEDRRRADTLRMSVARFLLRQHPHAERLRLFAVQHEIPAPWDLQGGMKLDDPQLFVERSLGNFTRADLE